MAYAAANSVMLAIYGFVDFPRISVASPSRETLLSAYNHARLLGSTLSGCSEVVTAMDEQIIIEEARRLQDSIEFAVATQILEQSERGRVEPTFFLNLDHLTLDIDCFSKASKKMKEHIEELWEQKATQLIEEHVVELCLPQKEQPKEDDHFSSSAADMVGLSDEFLTLRDALADAPAQRGTLQVHHAVVWISGMAGVGKTALLRRAFNDPSVKANFECQAFVRVGRECRVDRVLQAINAQLSRGDEMVVKEGDDEDAYETFCMSLRVKRCLIVLDDVWENGLDNLLKRKELVVDSGSWILVTSRIAPVFPYLNRSWKMRFLNDEESWELLKRKVFDEEEEECPPPLVEPGKKIAEKCGGLPLLIIAVANELRSKVQKNLECWDRVAEKPNSVLEDASNRISEVLLSSYNHLDEIYKLYFLYIAAFPQNYVVGRSMIINLWHAEGFHSFISQHIEKLKRKPYAFGELTRKNLLVVAQQKSWSSNEIKDCSLHIAYWYLCKRVAKDNRFLYLMNSYADGMDECVSGHHRLAIQTNVLFAIKEVHDNIASISTVRSVLCTGPYHQYQVPICFEWKLLRVLDALTIRFYEFPEVVKLILLRYLALTCHANLPRSISKLWSLQFLIVHQHWRIKRVAAESYVPVEIWDLQELVHLEIMGRNLPDPPHPGVVLPNLKKLLDVGVESCTKGVLESIPKLRKLRIQIELGPHATDQTMMCFDDISWIYNLESFQSVVMNPSLMPPTLPLSIPILSLQKLSLSGHGYPWEEMSKIVELPNLEVLKLRCYAFRGEKWEVNEEMRLSRLKYLFIEDTDLVQWTTKDENILLVVNLTIKNCHKLREIPRLSPHMRIELIDCNPLAESCARQRYHTSKGVTVTASYSWKEKKLKSS